MKLLAVPLGAIVAIDSNRSLGGTMSTFTVTYAVRRQMNELIDSLTYPSERKVHLADAAACESFTQSFAKGDVSSASIRQRKCSALYQALANHGLDSQEFEAAEKAWKRVNSR